MKLKLNRAVRVVVAGLLAALSLGAVALPPGTNAEILERIRPIGSLNVAEAVAEGEDDTGGDAEPRVARSGEQLYGTYCQACHQAGVAGAPMFGNEEAWEPRLAKGMDTLYASTINGLNIMPPRGTCPDCSDDELRGAVDYMVEAVN